MTFSERERLTARWEQWLRDGYTDNETPLDDYGKEVVRECLASLLAEAGTEELPVCEWREDGDDYDSEQWETTCGEAFCFIDGDPVTNNIRYCCYCGKPVKAVPAVPAQEQE